MLDFKDPSTMIVSLMILAALIMSIVALVYSGEVSTNAVETRDIQDLAVTSAKLAADAVTNAKLADDSVQTENILDGAVTRAKLDVSSDLIELADTTAITLDESTHAGRVLVVPDLTGNCTVTLPASSSKGVHYNFIYGGVADDGENLTITTSASTVFLKGSVHVSSVAAASPEDTVYADGTSNVSLVITDVENMDLHFMALSSTVWYVWGRSLGSATLAAFA